MNALRIHDHVHLTDALVYLPHFLALNYVHVNCSVRRKRNPVRIDVEFGRWIAPIRNLSEHLGLRPTLGKFDGSSVKVVTSDCIDSHGAFHDTKARG